ncbi:hypothetical protein [Paenarthrobacter sp. JL.01a]|uniref:hypothetical protein n=1 Tax=Paenarthrobacter sp. JL.01a TaxID=2979324 RepID=UPI0021C60995|nr:hypothetical protein [Paenarthrobacter sp. JL.01a]UXM93591.1 hypothetical protein N5P29_09920 [Paenarthrobacter sp. JL.01a]
MSKMWYLPLAAVLGAAGLSVWSQVNAAPSPVVSPGVVVSNVDTSTTPATVEDFPRPDDSPSAGPAPTPMITAVPEHTPGTRIVPAEPVTLPPVQVDDKGGLRAPGVSDDGATHDLSDDKGGLRDRDASDD